MPYRFLLIYLDVAILVISYEIPVNNQQEAVKIAFSMVVDLTTFEKLSNLVIDKKNPTLSFPKITKCGSNL